MNLGAFRLAVVLAAFGVAGAGPAGCGTTKAHLETASASQSPPAEVPADPPPAVVPPPGPPLAGPPAPDLPPPALPARRPKNILALSGGGAYGAYTAGVLSGWSRTNTRPEFDVVTGISTGALIAPLAFLGPKYDYEARKFYTEVRQKDVFAVRYWATIPFRDSLATTAPLRRLVEAGLTEEAVAGIAAEHKKGRRLYVGTTHLEGRRPVVWDIGAIAAKGGPDARKLILDVLVASCSLPGVFPPVPLPADGDGDKKPEPHVDGGVTAPVFVPAAVLDAAAAAGGDPGGNLYVVVAGKFYPEAAKVRPRVLKVLGASGAALLHAHARGELVNLSHLAKARGLKFHVVALRQDYPADETSMTFDPNVMGPLFVEGVKVGVAGPAWQPAPPERAAADPDAIRTGTRARPKP